MKIFFFLNKKYLMFKKIYLHSIKYISIILNNVLSKTFFRIIFIFYQCVVNCVMVSSKKSGL